MDVQTIKALESIELKVKWLSTWTTHNANIIRSNTDGVKVGRYQASCASISTIMTACKETSQGGLAVNC